MTAVATDLDVGSAAVPAVVTDLDPEKMLLEDVPYEKGPSFTISEMAKFFFARTKHWVRWLEQGGKLTLTDLDGSQRRVGDRRNDKGGRIYYLRDIEEVAHALAQNSAISGLQLLRTLHLVNTSAEMNGLIAHGQQED